jgi:N-acetylglucosaminyl-diphospho-decaprenol L-rhamnosyltransferase
VSTTAASSPSVTLSVVSHGQAALLQTLLSDLQRLCPLSLSRVVITVNLKSEILDDLPKLAVDTRVVRNEVIKGFGANHNAAFKLHCDTEYFLVINPDIRMTIDPLAIMLHDFRLKDGVLAPEIQNPDRTAADASRRLITPFDLFNRHIFNRHEVAEEGVIHWVAGMFMLFRSSAFRQCGGFDERYHMYCEDFDICARLQLANYDVRVVHSASVIHDAQRASRRSIRHLVWHISSLLKVWTSPVFWKFRAYLLAQVN